MMRMKIGMKIGMKRTNMIVFIPILILLLIACAAVLTSCSNKNYETNEHKIDGAFTDIYVKTDTADVVFIPSTDGECHVVCHEQKNLKHSVSVINGTLTVSVLDKRTWIEKIVGFETTNISVYLPVSEYAALTLITDTGDMKIPSGFKFSSIDISGSTGNVECSASALGSVKVKMSTGDVELEDMFAKSVSITVSTGDIELSDINCEEEIRTTLSTGKLDAENVSCKNFISDASTGDAIFRGVVASGKLEIKRDTGDVKFSSCDGAEIYIATGTGDVKGSFLSEKIIFAETDTGKIQVPKLTEGGRCEITTDTGNIIISIE